MAAVSYRIELTKRRTDEPRRGTARAVRSSTASWSRLFEPLGKRVVTGRSGSAEADAVKGEPGIDGER